MKLDNFSHNDNLYKYIVIIGLSLLLVPPLANNSLVNIMQREAEKEYELKKNNVAVKHKIESLRYFVNELDEKTKTLTKNIDMQIISMNIYRLDGTQIVSYAELSDFSRAVHEITSIDISSITDQQEIINILYQVIAIVGIPKEVDIMDIIDYLDNAKVNFEYRLAEADKILYEFQEEIARSEIEYKNLELESLNLIQESENLINELHKIALNKKIYKNEMMLISCFRVIGGLLIISGFILWYVRIQRYADNVYKNRLPKYKRRIKKYRTR
jgi:ribosomal protein L30E